MFTAVADTLAWAMQCEGIVDLIHYLDDFFFWSPAASQDCRQALEVAVPLCAKLGLPVAPHKVVGPSTSLVFLGIEIDSLRQEIKQALRQWGDKRAATKRELQSLIGHLNHAAKVVRPGRPFLRGLIDTMKIPHRQHHKVRLSVNCWGDVVWWQRLLASWNGVAFFPSGPVRAHLFSDASGLRCLYRFPRRMVSASVATVVVGGIDCPEGTGPYCCSSGCLGSPMVSGLHCDNEAVVHSVARGSAKDHHLNHCSPFCRPS